MQTWITDKDFFCSACNLDRNRLQANIYESIHILASLLNANDKLVNPKRSVKNHPNSKKWIGYEKELLSYIGYHLNEWGLRKYKSEINYLNFIMLLRIIFKNYSNYRMFKYKLKIPEWITSELIQTHRNILIKKNPEHYQKIWINK